MWSIIHNHLKKITMKAITVQGIEWPSVKGKDLYYLKLSNGKDELVINIGKGTYEGLKQLEKEETQPGTAPEKGGKK